jgi:hypothetical protein
MIRRLSPFTVFDNDDPRLAQDPRSSWDTLGSKHIVVTEPWLIVCRPRNRASYFRSGISRKPATSFLRFLCSHRLRPSYSFKCCF